MENLSYIYPSSPFGAGHLHATYGVWTNMVYILKSRILSGWANEHMVILVKWVTSSLELPSRCALWRAWRVRTRNGGGSDTPRSSGKQKYKAIKGQEGMLIESCINGREEAGCATIFYRFIRGQVCVKVHEFLPSLASDVPCKVHKLYFYFTLFIQMYVRISLLTLDLIWIWICVGLLELVFGYPSWPSTCTSACHVQDLIAGGTSCTE